MDASDKVAIVKLNHEILEACQGTKAWRSPHHWHIVGHCKNNLKFQKSLKVGNVIRVLKTDAQTEMEQRTNK
jgi:hypothetical protein